MSKIRDQYDLIAIGGSNGSTEILLKLARALPEDFPLPLVFIVHLGRKGKSLMPEILQNGCKLNVYEPEDKEPVRKGNIYLASPDYHLMLEDDLSFSYSQAEPKHYSRPSIDVFFESAADCCGNKVIGIILTGANKDGAYGLSRIEQVGGMTIIQDPADARSPEMPKAALLACKKPDKVMTSEEILTFLTTI